MHLSRADFRSLKFLHTLSTRLFHLESQLRLRLVITASVEPFIVPVPECKQAIGMIVQREELHGLGTNKVHSVHSRPQFSFGEPKIGLYLF